MQLIYILPHLFLTNDTIIDLIIEGDIQQCVNIHVKQIDSNKHTKGSACFTLSLLRPSNAFGRSFTITKTSLIVICIPTCASTLRKQFKTVILEVSLELSFSSCS